MAKFGAVFIFIAALLLASCDSRKSDNSHVAKVAAEAPLLTYCKNIDYGDTAKLHERMVMKAIVAKIVKMLPTTDSEVADSALTRFFSGACVDEQTVATAFEFAELYLDNPSSPVRNEDLYIRVLEALLSVRELPESLRLRAEYELKTANMNRPGTLATDFEYIDRGGRRASLHALNAERLMLIFYDPECSHCSDILNDLASDAGINAAIDAGSLTVLAVYAEGKKDVWERTCEAMPANWLVGYDLSGILKNELYDLPAMPVIYILDASKTILLKDPNSNLLLSRNSR